MMELINSHPDRIVTNLGVFANLFVRLVDILHRNGYADIQNGLPLEEQLGIFMYTCVTGLSSHLVGERFQRSPPAVTKCTSS